MNVLLQSITGTDKSAFPTCIDSKNAFFITTEHTKNYY